MMNIVVQGMLDEDLKINYILFHSIKPHSSGVFVSRYLFLHSYVRIRFIPIVLMLLLTNFVVWSWALEKHPEPETNPIF
jgi:hypothetical protein